MVKWFGLPDAPLGVRSFVAVPRRWFFSCPPVAVSTATRRGPHDPEAARDQSAVSRSKQHRQRARGQRLGGPRKVVAQPPGRGDATRLSLRLESTVSSTRIKLRYVNVVRKGGRAYHYSRLVLAKSELLGQLQGF